MERVYYTYILFLLTKVVQYLLVKIDPFHIEFVFLIDRNEFILGN